MMGGTLLRFNLHILQQKGVNSGSTFNALNAMLRPPTYEHEVRVPIEKVSAEDNMVLPSKEATRWLREERRKGTIGPWDSTLCNDALMPRWKLPTLLELTQPVEDTMVVVNEYYVVVSFLMEEDAVLFKMKW